MAEAKRGTLPEETSPPELEEMLEPIEKTPKKPDPTPPEKAKSKSALKHPTVAQACVRLDVFLRLAGRKPDQLAGFASHARTAKLGPRPIADWRRELSNFDHQATK